MSNLEESHLGENLLLLNVVNLGRVTVGAADADIHQDIKIKRYHCSTKSNQRILGNELGCQEHAKVNSGRMLKNQLWGGC